MFYVHQPSSSPTLEPSSVCLYFACTSGRREGPPDELLVLVVFEAATRMDVLPGGVLRHTRYCMYVVVPLQHNTINSSSSSRRTKLTTSSGVISQQ